MTRDEVDEVIDIILAASDLDIAEAAVADGARDQLVLLDLRTPHVAWVATNGNRVDARLTSDGREWWLVLDVDTQLAAVDLAAIVERPTPFGGIDRGRAVVLNGASSVGKTTVMERMVGNATELWIAFDELNFGKTNIAYLIWPEQAPTLRAGFVAGIVALAAAGNQVVFAAPDLAAYVAVSRHVPSLAVGLRCSLDELQRRQALRTDRWGGLTEESQAVHDGWTYDLEFDTQLMTADAVADAILAATSTMT